MAVVEAQERHEHLVEELIADVEAYKPDVDRDLLRRRSPTPSGLTRASAAARVKPSSAIRGAPRRSSPTLHLDEQTLAAALLHDVVEDTGVGDRGREGRVRRRDRPARRGRHEADADPVREPRARGGRELPQDDRGDGAGPPRHPHQARRPPAQHADDRVPRPSEAAAEGEGDARDVRADRAPARHPCDQVGARGSRLRALHPRKYAEIEAMVAERRGDRDGAREEGVAASFSASWRRPTSRPTSPAARSTSTRSTTRWCARAASSTRSTT